MAKRAKKKGRAKSPVKKSKSAKSPTRKVKKRATARSKKKSPIKKSKSAQSSTRRTNKSATAQSKKKQSAHKKKHPARPAKHPKLMDPFGIGVIASIPWDDPYKAAFENGLGMVPNHWNIQDGNGAGLQYENAGYVTALTALNNDIAVTLIVTCGGNISTSPAVQNPQKNTITLVGRKTTPNPGGKYLNRISLESVSKNSARKQYLHQTHGHDVNKICLLSNKNSAMAKDEQTGFGQRFIEIEVDGNTPDVDEVYAKAFDDIAKDKNGYTAVIVSADPWFKFTSSDLVSAANDWVATDEDLRVCYPVQEYENDNPAPDQTTLFGPSLVDAYDKLGQLAARVLDPANHPNPGQPGQIIKDI